MNAQINTEHPTPDDVVSLPGSRHKLIVKLDQDYAPSTDGRNLLLGFHFGSRPSQQDHPAIISLNLPPFNHEQLFEGWWYEGDVKHTRSGPVRIAECEDYTVAIVEKEAIDNDGFRIQTRQAYCELLEAINSTQHTKLVKVWNYFGEINLGNDDLEKYRQFSIGRTEAFQNTEICDEVMPTGTAIGTAGGCGLSLIAIASNRNFIPVENPRQVSAFHYPKKHGPSTPKFSRGGLVASDNHNLVLISGTASVVGHESNFPYDTLQQTDETFKNLDTLCDVISTRASNENQFVLDDESVLRVYLRNSEDYQSVADKIYKTLKRGRRNVAFLQGHICRRELMIEIDGVKVI